MKRLFTFLLLFCMFTLWCPADNITTLSESVAGKVFTINTARGAWYVQTGGTDVTACKGKLTSWPSGLNDGDYDYPAVTTPTKFALVKVTGKDYYYLYCVDESKWVKTNGTKLSLTDTPASSDYFGVENATGNSGGGTYPSCVFFGAESLHNMYGISPQLRTPDVYKYYSTDDAGNSSALTLETSQTFTVTEDLQAKVDGLWGAGHTVASMPIAAATDLKAGHKYLIHNISSQRNGYLHVDASHNLTYKALTTSTDASDFANFIFTVEENGGSLYLKANDNQYFPKPTQSSQPQTATVSTIDASGAVVLAAKSGYPATTFNLKVNTHYLNVTPGGVVTTWDREGDQNGVWEVTPVNEEWLTSTVNAQVTLANGTQKTFQKIADGQFMSGQTIFVAGNSFIPSVTTTVSSGTTTVNQTETLPFTISATIDDNATWYYLNLRDNNNSTNNSKKWIKYDASGNVSEVTSFDDNSKENFMWAFGGNSIDGIQLYNKAAGYSNSLQMTDAKATMAQGENDKWVLGKNSDGFTLRTSQTGTNYLHDFNGAWGYWNTADATTDEGSTFRAFSVELDNKYSTGVYALKNAAGTNYGFMGISETANGSTTYNLLGNKQTLDLNSIVQLTRLEPLHYNISIEGQKMGAVSQSANVSINTTNNAAFRMVPVGNDKFAFTSIPSGQYTYLHAADSRQYKLVGWSVDGTASQWTFENITKINYTSNEIATFYAPFDVYLFGATAYTVSLSADESTAHLTKVEATEEGGNTVTRIPANTGVILFKTSGTSNIQVKPVASNGITSLTSDLKGCYINTTWTASADGKTRLVLGKPAAGLGFYPNSQSYLDAHKCYIEVATVSAASKGISITIDNPTGVKTINATRDLNDKTYDLQGRPVGADYKGIVIKNGKKSVQ